MVCVIGNKDENKEEENKEEENKEEENVEDKEDEELLRQTIALSLQD